MEWPADTWTGIVTAITFMMGGVLCSASGFLFYNRKEPVWRTWPVETEVIRSLVVMITGSVFFHIAVSRIYRDELAYHVFDLNSVWTAVLRSMAVLVSIWWITRLAHDSDA